MKRHFKKQLAFLLILCTIVSWAAPSLAAKSVNMPYVIHETVDSQYLGSGIKYENIKKFTSKGWWNINVVRVDLTDEYAEIKGLMNNKGLSNTTTVTDMVNQQKAVAGVNGDFFNFSPMPHPMGTFIQDGEVISSPIERAYALPTFYIDSNNKADITFFDRRMNITNINTGKSVPISLINKAADMKMVTLLNKHWGYKSFGNKYNKDTVELVVVDNIIQEIRIGQPPIDIPKDGYIITVSGDRKEPLLENFNVGDEVKLNIGTTPNLENIKFAIGGGSIILKNGVPTNSNINIKGDHPRTGIGITEDGKELIIATIDGRHISYKGVSQEVFAQILKDLGAYNAINLDGGGSTTMAVKPIEEQVAKVVNVPSDGGQRRVPNGVGVFSNSPKGELNYIKVVTDDTNMFLNTSRRFSIKGYDQYHNPIEVDQSNVEYSFEGIEGEMEGNVLKANSKGKATVTANYNGLTASIDVKILDEVKSFTPELDKFNITTNSQRNIGSLSGIDRNGFKAKIYPEDVEWSVNNDIGYVEEGVFYSGEKTGSGAITGR
ncbi:MAG: phosphodiester glycosidase family protein, partial [Tissierellia bacterium]|nr:phosphodiester glycosidase family protein [Tissierellia bacterium]